MTPSEGGGKRLIASEANHLSSIKNFSSSQKAGDKNTIQQYEVAYIWPVVSTCCARAQWFASATTNWTPVDADTGTHRADRVAAAEQTVEDSEGQALDHSFEKIDGSAKKIS